MVYWYGSPIHWLVEDRGAGETSSRGEKITHHVASATGLWVYALGAKLLPMGAGPGRDHSTGTRESQGIPGNQQTLQPGAHHGTPTSASWFCRSCLIPTTINPPNNAEPLAIELVSGFGTPIINFVLLLTSINHNHVFHINYGREFWLTPIHIYLFHDV